MAKLGFVELVLISILNTIYPVVKSVSTRAMEQELGQFVQAILIASDPLQGALHQQALEYISTIQQNVTDTWRLALALFIEAGPHGSRKYPPQARFFALRVLEDFLDNR